VTGTGQRVPLGPLPAAACHDTGGGADCRPRRSGRQKGLGTLLLVGPDGAGKSSVADEIEGLATRSHVQVVRLHCRPTLRPRDTVGSPVVDPHSAAPYPFPLALAKIAALVLVWLQHSVRQRLRSDTSTLTIVERGWFDMAVDPVRYRLPPKLGPLVAAAGRLVRPADIIMMLAGAPASIDARKPEIGIDEVARQIERWQQYAPRAGRLVLTADVVAQDPVSIARAAWTAATATSSRYFRWRTVPLTAARTHAKATGDSWYARTFFRSYNPAARALAPLSNLALWLGLGRSAEPPASLEEIGRFLNLDVDGALAIDSSTPGRLVVVCGTKRSQVTVVKIAGPNDERLANEAALLTSLAESATDFSVPRLRWTGPWRERLVVAMDAVTTANQPIFDVETACRLSTALVNGLAPVGPVVHGDLAPWNVLGLPAAPVLIDWEYGRRERLPLFDLAHFVVACGALLGRHTEREARSLLCDPGGPGWRHLEAVDADPHDGERLLRSYYDSGLWIGGHRERAFWLRLLPEPRNRRVA
jgi:hypothetical protein